MARANRVRQARSLNTNMRYLHEAVIELAERLVDSMPAGSGLDMVMMVNSGSEANDLATMIARLHTGHFDVISLRNGYHGGTAATMGLTPGESDFRDGIIGRSLPTTQ